MEIYIKEETKLQLLVSTPPPWRFSRNCRQSNRIRK